MVSRLIAWWSLFTDKVAQGRDRRRWPVQVPVRVFHNLVITPGLVAYRPDHTVTEVFATFMATAEPLATCEAIFELLNVGHDPDFTHPVDDRAVAYRARGNRSLSVGDVIAVGRSFFAVSRVGMLPISTPNIVIGGAHGTTHIAEGAWPTPTIG